MKKIFFLLATVLIVNVATAQTQSTSTVSVKTKSTCKNKKRVAKVKPIVNDLKVIETTEAQTFTPKQHPNPLPIAPMYKDGQQALIDFINSTKKVPADIKKNNITMTVTVTFNVAIDGTLKDIKAVKADQYGCDSEAERIVRLMPKWIAGRVGRQFVEMPYAIDIEFK